MEFCQNNRKASVFFLFDSASDFIAMPFLADHSEANDQGTKSDSSAGRMPGTRSVCSGSMQDIAGLKSAKQTLTEAILFPVLYPNLFGPHRRPWRCILVV